MRRRELQLQEQRVQADSAHLVRRLEVQSQLAWSGQADQDLWKEELSLPRSALQEEQALQMLQVAQVAR
jgi:hypothetical protein